MCIPIIITDESITNPTNITCYSICDSDVIDTDNMTDTFTDDVNECCNSASRTSGFGDDESGCTKACKFYYNHCISLHILAIYIHD